MAGLRPAELVLADLAAPMNLGLVLDQKRLLLECGSTLSTTVRMCFHYVSLEEIFVYKLVCTISTLQIVIFNVMFV